MRGLIWTLAATAAVSLLAYFFWSRLDDGGRASKRDVTLAQTGAGDRLAAGRNVTVETPIDGDLAVAGAAVTVSDPVMGYVLAAGKAARAYAQSRRSSAVTPIGLPTVSASRSAGSRSP